MCNQFFFSFLGLIGFDKVIWYSAVNENSVTFSYLSKG
jgi:hypothetical protein